MEKGKQLVKVLSQVAVDSVLLPLVVRANKMFKNIICTMWIFYTRDEAKKVHYGKLNQIAPPSKQLIVDWIPAGIKSLYETPYLVCKPFLVTCMNSNLNGADGHIIQS